MSCRHLHRCALRFPRTAAEAFPKTASYGAAIEKPLPSVWKRMFNSFMEWMQ